MRSGCWNNGGVTGIFCSSIISISAIFTKGSPLLIWLARPRVRAGLFRPPLQWRILHGPARDRQERIAEKILRYARLFREKCEPAFAIINFLLFPPCVFRAGSTL